MGDRLRVGFADIANRDWGAGATYYVNLLSALGTLDSTTQPHTAVVLWPEHDASAPERYRELADETLRIPPAPAQSFAQRQLARAKAKLGVGASSHRHTANVVRAHKIDALFTCWREFGPTFPVPVLGWIPDFQHVHLPELFSADELRFRDELFARMGDNCARIVLSSRDAQRDFERFSPQHASKARVLQFVSALPSDVHEHNVDVCTAYSLPERFVYLPNQLWAHKNHHLVLDALAKLRRAHPEIVVVSTGNPSDNRDASYVGELLARVSRLGVRDNFVVLGWVPRRHTFDLMRQSLAVLQPSKFEGWSTTVEECKSLGKAIVLSDIPVHREQAPPAASYFDPLDASALANELIRMFDERSPGPDLQLEANARAALPARMRAYAETFVALAEEVRPA